MTCERTNETHAPQQCTLEHTAAWS